MAKKKDLPTVKKTLNTVVISAKRLPKPVAKIDSIPVGGVKRHVKDVSGALSQLNKSASAKGYVKGVDQKNPVNSSRQLSGKSSTSDLVNKVIDSKKKKPNYITKR